MKKHFKLGTVIVLVIFALTVCTLSMISYSDNGDPLVTLSYLTEIVMPQMKNDILAEITIEKDAGNVLTDENGNIITGDANNKTEGADGTDSVPNPSNSYTLVELTKGQSLYATSVLELIVRPGSEVAAVSPFEAQGIADVTGSREYLNGDIIEINSYCIIPRGSDGRGFTVLNEKSYILVRGEYYIG